jgi:hypothetical protein
VPQTTLRTVFPFLVAGLTAFAGVLPAKKASAASPYLAIPSPSAAEATAAYRYANMTAAEALAELDKRKVPYKVADPVAGVIAPVRLTGKLHGVYIHSAIPESQRATSVYEVLDARLALALDDFAKILSRHDIEEVVHYSLYRPNVPHKDHDLKEPKLAAAASAPAAETKPQAASPKPTAALATSAAPGAKAGTVAPGAKAGVAPGTAPGAKTSVLPAMAPGAKAGAAPAKAGAPAVKAPPAPVKAGAPAARPAPALPPLPTGKAFPSPPSKGERASARGAKQKTPAVVEKKATPPAPAAPSTKAGPPNAAGRGTTPAAGRGVTPAATKPPAGRAVGARAAITPQKAGAAPARSRVAAPEKATKVEAKAPAPAAPVAPLAVAAKPAAAPVRPAPVSRQTWAAPGTRHPAGLAIDVAMLKKRDGQWISVASHFRGRIGDKTCGDGVRTADTPEARELRSVVCESNDQGVFTYVLTPNFNAAHFDHFHMEIRPQVKWFLYH